MKIAVAQISCSPGNIAANVEKMRRFAERAARTGTSLIVFPEMSDTGYVMDVIRKTARPWNEGAVPELQEMARRFSLGVVAGVSEKEGDCIYNSQVAINACGEIAARYRKVHLFAPSGEDKCCTAGDSLTSIIIGPWQFGLTICYDLRFPELYRTLALEHLVTAFLNSSAWPFPRLEHLRILATARAIENQSYFLLANRVGNDKGVTFCGSSVVIDPYGVVLSAASADREELIFAELSTEVLDAVRKKLPVFAHRRPALYRCQTRHTPQTQD
ncbi:MAG TPA: nitrilase-related carbon-nitrogen hydrolase [Chthoniobacterales bacterium]